LLVLDALEPALRPRHEDAVAWPAWCITPTLAGKIWICRPTRRSRRQRLSRQSGLLLTTSSDRTSDRTSGASRPTPHEPPVRWRYKDEDFAAVKAIIAEAAATQLRIRIEPGDAVTTYLLRTLTKSGQRRIADLAEYAVKARAQHSHGGALADAYQLESHDAELLRSVALHGVGRDSPDKRSL
jgi:hypothetical protein